MKTHVLYVLAFAFYSVTHLAAQHGEPPLRAPFAKAEDSLCVNDWWQRPANEIIELKVPRDQVVCFGIYTVHNRVLKLSAQLYPLYPEEPREVRLEIQKDGAWMEVARQNVNDLGWSTTFHIAGWDESQDFKYRLLHGGKASFQGLVRKNPVAKEEIVLAALSCNSNKDRGLRPEYTTNINHQDPDLVFFAGDQSYDHILDPNYDPKVIDTPGLELLGTRQEKFLADWAGMRDGVAIKAVLSQTGFCGGAHLHGSRDNRLHADLDSNGWPQSGRNRALELVQKARAVHIAGDQHIATVVRHGIRDYGDGPWAFVVPAIVNSYYGRWWWPEAEKPGANPVPGSPLPWTGDYLDGFNNKISMVAYANPHAERRQIRARDKDNAAGIQPKEGWADGWGLIRFKKKSAEVTFECWPRFSDVTKPGAKQFPGWPVTVKP